MISSKIKSIFVLVSLLLNISLSAQNVHYYKLTRKIEKSVSSRDVSGGQFINFVGNICFECNRDGLNVGHGHLTKNNSYSNSEKTTYMGSSYWGESTSFIFNADRSVLNVVLDNGDVYIYKRATPPAGVTTCSLIRKVERNPNNDFTPTPAPTPYPPNPYTPTPTPTPNPTPDPPTPNPVQPHQVTKDCNLCHGSGKCPTCNGKHWYYGIGGSVVTCPNCTPNGACSSCGGSGKKTTTEYR